MKTIKYWLDTFPEPYKTQALRNTSILRLSDIVSCASDALFHAFSWSSTAQGERYWVAYHASLSKEKLSYYKYLKPTI